MTRRISDTKPVSEFIETATCFCLLLENHRQKTQIRFLQEVFIQLAQLCISGMRLPDIKRLIDYDVPGMPHGQWKDMYQSLKNKIGQFNTYFQVSDPYDIDDRKPMQSIIADDISDIYQDIKPGLQEWENGDANIRLNIIWEWKFGYMTHWGEHATRAYNALYYLLYQHIEDKNGDDLHIGIREIEME